MSYNCAIHFEYLKNMSGYGFEVELKSVNWRVVWKYLKVKENSFQKMYLRLMIVNILQNIL
ncbi:hypothetical protein X975_14565, partial [Stegodyphus mimosarum]